MTSCLDLLSEAERRELARHLDSAEAWLRRLIDHQLRQAFGADYFGARLPDDAPVIPRRIREAAEKRQAAEPGRFSRPVDATTLEKSIDIVLHERLYEPYFRSALVRTYLQGREEARTYLTRLNTHRNLVQHLGNPSARAVEQCVCYANDLVDAIKAFFVEENVDRQFNVPTFVRVVDNRGNERHFAPPEGGQGRFVDFRGGPAGDLYPGDVLSIEVEVDESFTGYQVRWLTFNGDRGEGGSINLTIEHEHVGEQMDIRFEVVSAEPWHRLHGDIDDMLDLRYRVLPPKK